MGTRGWHPYPLWGVEEPRRVWTGRSLYRGGEKDIFMRYVVRPRALPVLDYGVTVLDVLLCIAVALIVGLFAYAAILGVGHGIDGWLDACGY